MEENIKLRVTGRCEGNSPVAGEFPSQMTSSAENVTIWWRHDDFCTTKPYFPKLQTSAWFIDLEVRLSGYIRASGEHLSFDRLIVVAAILSKNTGVWLRTYVMQVKISNSVSISKSDMNFSKLFPPTLYHNFNTCLVAMDHTRFDMVC